jgi:threonylcarbamoyladenosine tRNA methylthiotransferase CDKAL1
MLPLYKERQEPCAGPPLPGAHAVHIRTYGCSHNVSDSEYMAGQLAAYGYTIVEDEEQADIIIMNSCTVKGPSQDSFLSAVRKHKGKQLIVAGCVPQADQDHPLLKQHGVIGVQQIDHVVDAVEDMLAGSASRRYAKDHLPSLHLPKIRKNRLIEIIPISLGCLGACTYCKTKHARGHLRSYAQEEIIARARHAISEGVAELWLTSEDSGAYGRDIGTALPSLLLALADSVPEHVMIRLGMTNPPYILEHLEQMAQVLSHPRVYSFLHIPVQAGSDRVLDAMNREYTIEEFQRVVDFLKEKVPGMTIATDIICGFPAETEEDFARTLELVESNAFPILNISQFYSRPGTPASRMKQLPSQTVKRRSTELTRLFKSQFPYRSLVGTHQRVWITDVAADGHLIGHTKSYVQVLLAPGSALPGTSVVVTVTEAGKHFIRAQV